MCVRFLADSAVKWAQGVYQHTYLSNFGRDIILGWAKQIIAGKRAVGVRARILDIGFGSGDDLINIRKNCGEENVGLLGLDCGQENVEKGRANGIDAYCVNIETSAFPFADASVDMVIGNQIIEHSKEIFWIFSEISRVIKPGGFAIIGVPNMASLHNRILFLFGLQPTCIDLVGPHVRGLTYPAFKKFIETDGYFRLRRIRGANFYPFFPPVNHALSRLFPKMSVSIFFLIERTDKAGVFKDVLKTRQFETPFYAGPRA